MNMANFEFWQVVVKPGETVKCDPGEIYCHISQITLDAGKGKDEDVRVFVKVDGKEILICTLSVDKHPLFAIDLVFDKEFELLHTSKTSNISAIGYKFSEQDTESDTCTEEDDESDEECPLAVPLYPDVDDDKSKETKSGTEKLTEPKPAAAQSSKPKVTSEEINNSGKLKAGVSGLDNDESEDGDDEDSSDEDDRKSSDEEDDKDSPKNAKRKNRPTETPLKTPPQKKAKIATPSIANKSGGGTAKRSSHVHVATPYPSKQVKKTPSLNYSYKQSTSYACKSCSKTFNSSIGLETHCKVKHSAHK